MTSSIEWTPEHTRAAAGELFRASDELDETLKGRDWLGRSAFGSDAVGTLVYSLFARKTGPVLDAIASEVRGLDDHGHTLNRSAATNVGADERTAAAARASRS